MSVCYKRDIYFYNTEEDEVNVLPRPYYVVDLGIANEVPETKDRLMVAHPMVEDVKKWAVTDVATGKRIGSGQTISIAKSEAAERIIKKGSAKYISAILYATEEAEMRGINNLA